MCNIISSMALSNFIKKFHNQKKSCSLCGNNTFNYDSEERVLYCSECGLVVKATYYYVAGNKIKLDYGLIL